MSIFTSLVSQVLDVPGVAGATVTVRKLAPKHLDAARKASQDKAFAEMKRTREALDQSFLDRVMETMAGAGGPVKAADPLLAYDRVTLMEAGVTAWSFDLPVTRETLEDLDEDTADWLARAILRLSRPALFESEAEQEAARKNA